MKVLVMVNELTQLSAELMQRAKTCRAVAPGLSYKYFRQSEVCKAAAEELKEMRKGGEEDGEEGNTGGD